MVDRSELPSERNRGAVVPEPPLATILAPNFLANDNRCLIPLASAPYARRGRPVLLFLTASDSLSINLSLRPGEYGMQGAPSCQDG
jgi:hypothetical protein